MELKKQLWTLQLLRYFIFAKNYTRISIAMKDDPTQPDDSWLVNTDARFQVIHISDQSDNQRKAQQLITRAAFEKISAFVKGPENARYLDISFSSEATDYQNDGITYIHMHPSCELSGEVNEDFPNLGQVIHETENMQKDKTALEREVVLLSISQQNKRQTGEARKQSIARFKCKTFLIPAIVCVLMWGAVMAITYLLNTDNVSAAISIGAYYKAFVVIFHQYWRLFTGGLIHISIVHLLCNLVSLYSLGSMAEREFGFGKSMLILVSGIIIGNLLEFVAGPNQVTVGISGGLYGLLGALTITYIRKGYFRNPIFRNTYMSTLYINILISLMPNVSWMAHLGGMIGGAFVSVLISEDFSRSLRINVAVCALILACAVGYIGYKNANFKDFYYGTDKAVAAIYDKVGLDDWAKAVLTDTLKYYEEHQ